jgi:ornithine cyclodeaminase/alanine dehydrogenase-like protein (mu-crystallin family)
MAPVADPRFVSAETLRAAMSFTEAADALAAGLSARTDCDLDPVPRSVVVLPGGDELLVMPAHGKEGAGVKLVTIARGNPARGAPTVQGLYTLFGREDRAPRLIVDGAGLTRLRTAAVSALATRALARPESRRLVVFGAGVQAAAHVEAMRAVLPIEEVTVVGSGPDSLSAHALVDQLRRDGLTARLGVPRDVAQADVVCTCTTAEEPVFADADLPSGVHVNAIGAYRASMCELPPELLGRALLVVESEAGTRGGRRRGARDRRRGAAAVGLRARAE